MSAQLSLIEVIFVSFTVGAPVQVIAAVFQWLLQFRLIPNYEVDRFQGLLCILYTSLSAFLLSLILLLVWPFDHHTGVIPLLINDVLSVPTIIATAIAMPYWLYRFHYLPVNYQR